MAGIRHIQANWCMVEIVKGKLQNTKHSLKDGRQFTWWWYATVMVNDEELMVEKIGPGTPGVLINSGLDLKSISKQ